MNNRTSTATKKNQEKKQIMKENKSLRSANIKNWIKLTCADATSVV